MPRPCRTTRTSSSWTGGSPARAGPRTVPRRAERRVHDDRPRVRGCGPRLLRSLPGQAGRERPRVTDVVMTTPIRYAAGDPVESWAFGRSCSTRARRSIPLSKTRRRRPWRTGGSPPPSCWPTNTCSGRRSVCYFVLAHYRTEPDDLARLLDAPNVTARALTHDGHVVSVALLAREGTCRRTCARPCTTACESEGT